MTKIRVSGTSATLPTTVFGLAATRTADSTEPGCDNATAIAAWESAHQKTFGWEKITKKCN